MIGHFKWVFGNSRNAVVPLTKNKRNKDTNKIALNQREVVAFLENPHTWNGADIKRIDTHISHVFLTGDRAYKLKRELKLEFLDFSTIELRRLACLKEVEINRRYAPDLYLGVVPIMRHEGVLHLGGRGKPVDWLVSMHQFNHKTTFDHLASQKTLTDVQVEALADKVAESHMRAPLRPDHGGYCAMNKTFRNIAFALNGAAQDLIELGIIDKMAIRVERMLMIQANKLNIRKRHGYVRFCHGDLHLGNVCLFNDTPTLFDAIEFNEHIASIDTMYDLAFLAMDMIRYGSENQANLLLNRYLSATRDYSGLRLLPVFMTCRAMVRALVSAISYRQASKDNKRIVHKNAAQQYFELSQKLVKRPSPRLIAIGGLSGTGKSTLAKELSQELNALPGAIIIRNDVIRKRMLGLSPETPLPRESYNPDFGDRVYRRLAKETGYALRAGWPVIADATFLSARDQITIEHVAHQHNVRFDGLWLEAPVPVLENRVRHRQGDASDATVDVIHKQRNQYDRPNAWHCLATNKDIHTVTADARSLL